MIPVFGHAGDGNLHPNILCDRRDAEEMKRVREAAREIFEAAVELGGTLSGEHGIGLLKKQFMEMDVGPEALRVMRAIKTALDPLGIMNPGKIFPDPGGVDAFTLPGKSRIVSFIAPDIPPADVFNRCVRCGLCLPTCPTYVETLVETSGPRGRIALIKAVAEGRLNLTSPGFVHQMSECLDCRACEAVCPSGVEYGRLLEPARTQVQRAIAERQPWHVRTLRWFLLDRVFSSMALLRFVAALLRVSQKLGLQSLARSDRIVAHAAPRGR